LKKVTNDQIFLGKYTIIKKKLEVDAKFYKFTFDFLVQMKNRVIDVIILWISREIYVLNLFLSHKIQYGPWNRVKDVPILQLVFVYNNFSSTQILIDPCWVRGSSSSTWISPCWHKQINEYYSNYSHSPISSLAIMRLRSAVRVWTPHIPSIFIYILSLIIYYVRIYFVFLHCFSMNFNFKTIYILFFLLRN